MGACFLFTGVEVPVEIGDDRGLGAMSDGMGLIRGGILATAAPGAPGVVGLTLATAAPGAPGVGVVGRFGTAARSSPIFMMLGGNGAIPISLAPEG